MKLRNKLILSCAALAACATTMVSTTFAWYTSNTEVSATGVNGSTAEAGSNLLLISEDGNHWGTAVDLTNKLASVNTKLTPLAWNGKNLVNFDYNNGTLTSETTDQEGYLAFDLYFKLASASTTENLYVESFAITNNDAAALPTKSVITAGKDHIDPELVDSTYTVNALRVLKTTVAVEGLNGASGYNKEAQAYDLSTLNANESYKDTLGTKTNYDAHKYLKAVMKKQYDIAATQVSNKITASDGVKGDGSTKKDWIISNLPSSTGENEKHCIKVTFKLFLDGADKACFDAVQKQSFSVSLKFTTDATKALTLNDTAVGA